VDGVPAEPVADGVFTRYAVPAASGVEDSVAEVTLVRAAGPAPEAVTGVQGRASAPSDKYFDTVAAEYRVEVPDALPPGTLLRLHWSGDVGRAYVGDALVADQFFSGRWWDIGLDRLPADELRAEGLRLRVLPLPAGAPVHLPEQAGGAGERAVVTGAEWITRRSRSVRAS
jgi:hypothetical protein